MLKSDLAPTCKHSIKIGRRRKIIVALFEKDQLVYALYGLTEDEIKIVEQS